MCVPGASQGALDAQGLTDKASPQLEKRKKRTQKHQEAIKAEKTVGTLKQKIRQCWVSMVCKVLPRHSSRIFAMDTPHWTNLHLACLMTHLTCCAIVTCYRGPGRVCRERAKTSHLMLSYKLASLPWLES